MTSVGSATWRRPGLEQTLLAAGLTDAGVQREVNEDRFYVDAGRGLFVVIDGVGGQAAGGRAADVALARIRERLERETGPVNDRIREAISIANNEIHRLASTRPEWAGMACVLTIAVVHDGKATIGHVGDTRLYKLRAGRIEKITRDHSPVGEREDAGELSESKAMRHPRRNEVYRDVGSERHDPADADFIDLSDVLFEADAALLLCTDGLTDLVDSASIAQIVWRRRGDPEAVAAALIEAANEAGGKDNVTVVYVEGEQFAGSTADTRRTPAPAAAPPRPGAHDDPRAASRARRTFVVGTIVALLAIVIGTALARRGFDLPATWFRAVQAPVATIATPLAPDVQVVQPGGSIAEAIRSAVVDSEIVVEPGEYREAIVLKDRVRLVSRVPRGATIRLPAAAPDSNAVPAIAATGLSQAELVGFRIVGDSATPLAVGVRVENSSVSLVDVEIAGATRAAVEFSGAASAALLGSDIRDNPGAAVIVHDGASPRVAHNVFARNGTSERSPGTLVLAKGSAPRFTGNIFVGRGADSLGILDAAVRATLKNENWFVPVSQRRTSPGAASIRPRRSR